MTILSDFPTGPILCGVDFSDDSRRALALAAALASRLARPLSVVTVVEPLLANAADVVYGRGRLDDDARKDLEAFVASTIPAGAAWAPLTTCRVEVGQAAQVLVSRAVADGAAMIVVGMQGSGLAKRLLLGSTTLRVLRAAKAPVLAVPRHEAGAPPKSVGADAGFRRILCGVDFGAASDAATLTAAALGELLALPVTLVHAVNETGAATTFEDSAMSTTARVTAARDRLQKCAAQAAPSASVEVRIGEPAPVLIALAADGPPALIVLGLGSSDPAARPGTTAHRVLTDGHTAVLAVPA